jgi:D-alanyl-D-alanine carboxypeptidase
VWAEALVRRGIVGAVTWVDGVAEAAGLADVANGEPMTPEHRFRVGSVTKTFTAYLTTLLVDDLDAVAVEPDVSFRHLLTHRSGLFDATWDGELWSEWLFGPPAAVDPHRVTAVSLSYPRRFPPGEQQQYCNTNYEFLGLLLQERAGAPFAELLRAHVFEPLGLQRTTFEEQPVVPAGAAHGYALKDGMMPVDQEPRDVTEYLIGAWADGAIASDVADIARFYAHVVPLLVDSELGLHPVETPCGTAWGHSGGIAGYLANVRCSRDGGHVALAFSNTQGVKVAHALNVAAAKLYCAGTGAGR